MSVQAGIWNFDGEEVERDTLARMSLQTAEYGPDGEAIHIDGGIGMLYRPFHTTPESRLEHQPHSFANGKVITWDGRLDNRDELISQLGERLSADSSDVTIVAAAYGQWGAECFGKLVGDWALTIWDAKEQELLLARDYIGIRQLFYYAKPNGVIWCSHLDPLALEGGRFSLCHEYIAGFLAFRPDANLTPYAEIRSVPPGMWVWVRHGRIAVQTHWALDLRRKTRYKNDAEYEEHFRHLFRLAVRRRIASTSPILAELSGGLDSSSIVCTADDILAKEGATTPRIDTFSYYDSKDPDGDDLPYITKVEETRRRIGFHADLSESAASFSLEYPTFIATPGFAEREELTKARLDLRRQQEHRVLLAGTGGDELLGQALDPRVQMADLLLAGDFTKLAKLLIAWSIITRQPWIQLFFQTLSHALPYWVRTRISAVAKVEPWLNRTFAKHYRIPARRLEAIKGMWIWSPGVRDSLQTIASLARQMTQTRPTTYEIRYPYLDRTLVEFLTSIPNEQLLRPGERRSLMRRALSEILPPEIAARSTKAGASRCYAISLEKYWANIDSILRSSLSARLGYVHDDVLRATLRSMKAGTFPLYFLRPLRALSLEAWLRAAATRGVLRIASPVRIASEKYMRESSSSSLA
ncbi:MAG TPA: asparagine synthase-related protein [Candidatus Angelobacter sp.]